MKKTILILILILCSNISTFSQAVNGEILSDSNNVTVVKLWGTSEERGFAYGYLTGDKMIEVLEEFIIPFWGEDRPVAKQIIADTTSFHIDPVYWHEARAMMDGATAAGFNPSGYDSLDVIAANCISDIYGWQIGKEKSGFHCSTLMNWNEATAGTDLNGCSVISRHMDTYINSSLQNNAIIVSHIPSEPDLQLWLLIDCAGQMAPKSGINSNGLALFTNGIDDQPWNYSIQAGYEPFIFTFRKALKRLITTWMEKTICWISGMQSIPIPRVIAGAIIFQHWLHQQQFMIVL